MIRLVWLAACLLCAATALAHAVECPGSPPGFIKAEGSGCKLWNLCPQLQEKVMWSGDCVDGFAEGTGVAASFLAGEPDDRYEGHLRRGKAEG